MSLAEYLELLDWTGRQLKPGKCGSMAANAPPIPDRLNLSPELWLQTVAGFSKRRSARSVTPSCIPLQRRSKHDAPVGDFESVA